MKSKPSPARKLRRQAYCPRCGHRLTKPSEVPHVRSGWVCSACAHGDRLEKRT